MANSPALLKGQSFVLCHLCETDPNIKWKCLDCELLMCTRCKDSVHSKIKTSKEHKIIDIKEIGNHSKEPDFEGMKCVVHSEQSSCMFCSRCNQLVCPLCISKVHDGHGLKPISEGYQVHLGKLRDRQILLDANINILEVDVKKIQYIRKAETYKYTEAKNQIQTQNTALKKAVDKLSEKLLKDLDKVWESLQNMLNEEEKRLCSLKQNMEDQRTKSKITLISNNIAEQFKEFKTIEKLAIDTIKPNEIKFPSTPKFSPGEITLCNIGYLNDNTEDITGSLIKQYIDSDITHSHHLATDLNGSVWIGDNVKKIIQKSDPKGDKLTMMFSCKTPVYGMATTQSGDLLVCVGSKLKQISGRYGKITDSVYITYPLKPTAVHVTSNENVIVGARDPDFNSQSDKGRRALMVMKKDGSHVLTCELDKTGQKTFTNIWSISSTKAGTILVLDASANDESRRVVVLAEDGDILNLYTGNPIINTEDRPFRPCRIVTTILDNVIISDYSTSVLHILNSIGYPLTHFNTQNIGITHPFSLGYDSSGQLYIGCRDNGNLYVLEMLGC